MSGGFSRVSGSTGQAPTTVWMNPVADRLTMMMPWDEFTASYTQLTALASCNVPNNFILFHSSFGPFTTAPDGSTNVALKVIEDSTTNMHGIRAGTPYDQPMTFLRFAGIFKAAERTRVAIKMSVIGGSFTDCTTMGYDLAGGQLAYGPTQLGSNVYVPLHQEIRPLGSGWYLCILDIQCNASSNFLWMRAVIDSGSGTAAESTNYAGNGTSGIYAWKQSVLPVQAWNISSTTLFDDFNSLSTIDINNSKLPGFNWYVDNFWPGYITLGGPAFPTPGTFSVSGSVLHMPGNYAGVATDGGGLYSAGVFPRGDPRNGTFVGNGYKPPLLMEANFRWPYDTFATTYNGDFIWWADFLDFLVDCSKPPAQQSGMTGAEFDWYELNIISGTTDTNSGGFGVHRYAQVVGLDGLQDQSVVFTGGRAQFGIVPWVSNNTWSGGRIAQYAGVNYYQNQSTPYFGSTSPPPSDPGHWTTPVHYGTIGQGSTTEFPVVMDPTNFHTYSALIIPHNANGDFGQAMIFYDGMHVSVSNAWGPAPFGNGIPYIWTADSQKVVLIIQPGQPGGLDMFVDWIRVMQ